MKRHEDKVLEWEEIAATAMAVQNSGYHVWILVLVAIGAHQNTAIFIAFGSKVMNGAFFYLGKYDALMPLRNEPQRS